MTATQDDQEHWANIVEPCFSLPVKRVRTTSLSRSLTQTGDFAAIVASHDLELVLPHADQIWGVGDGTLITGTLHEPTGQTALSTQLAAIPP